MTEVEFHTGVVDKLGFACRLLRKAYRKGARLIVTGPAPLLTALDRELWTFAERDFIPHLRLSSAVAPTLLVRTPIWLVDDDAALLDNGLPDDAPTLLVNLGSAAPANPVRFQRIIEVLSTDADDQRLGRERWRDYKASGLNVAHHPAVVSGAA